MGDNRSVERVICQFVRGPSHEDDNSPCQDFAAWDYSSDTGQWVLVVSDGAGSCENSHHGAECAVRRSIEFCKKNDLGFRDGDSDQIGNDLISFVLDGLNDVATRKEISLRSLSCTLLVAVWSPKYCRVFQVGDGSLSVELVDKSPSDRNRGVLATVFVDDSEYVNETTFVTSKIPKIQYRTLDQTRIKSFILGTDGIDPLATNGICASPDFYAPILKGLKSSTDKVDVAKLEAEMGVFLDSRIARERSSDDKTLLIATI